MTYKKKFCFVSNTKETMVSALVLNYHLVGGDSSSNLQ